MSKYKDPTILDEIWEYIAEKIISIAFSLMPKSKMKTKLASFILETFGGNK